MPRRTITARGKTRLISPHAWNRIRQIDIDLADVVRIIETPLSEIKLKHKTEYMGCFTPKWAVRESVTRNLLVKIVVNTRSTLILKTVHISGDCPEEESNQ